ncbi:putative ubiquitin system component CUE, UBA-like superfamily [Helianthus anomalus]
MSNHQRYSTKNKTHQQRFVPKSSQPLNQNPNLNPTLSDSLRKQQSLSSSRPQSGDDGGSFVNYLPQDEAVAAGLGAEEGGLDPVESQRVVDLLNRECSRLLKLNAKYFWKQVASDTSLHAFLESFLKYRSRWYDFPYRGAKGIVAGVIVGEHELNRRVFMILYRMSSNRDPGAKASDSLSARDHAGEKKLLDLPKLLDICAIYGHENEELTRLIVTNAIKAQPLIHDSFTAAISHFLNIVHTMYERCITSLEVLFSSREAQDNGFAQLQTDYLEIMDFINDAIVSMDALVTAYNYAAVYFSSPVETSYGSDEMVKIFARLHDSLLPALQQGFRIIFTAEKDKLAEVVVSLKMLASRIVKFSWNLLNFSYLSEEVFNESVYFPSSSKIFPAQVEDPVIRADILVQTFREISEECSTVHEGKNAMSLLQSVEKSYQLMSRLELLRNQGWILMDDEQLRFLSGIISVANGANVLLLPSNKVVEMDEDNAITESKISQVKDLFPDYGNGFISACLDVYNDNPEEVIQRILEGTLDKDLQSLDTSLAVLPPKTAVPPVGKKDKGKGKLVEPELDYIPPKPRIEGPSSTSSSSVGRFVRKSTANVPDSEILNSKDETSKSFALKSLLEYEDEYDDSFDDLGLSVGDAGLDDLSEKVTSNEVSASEASKWGSRQKPQFYVKDGKNYSYKVSGSVAAANYNEASVVNQAQKELIHGLGRGGNFPLGAAQKVMEVNERKYVGEQNMEKKDVNAPVKSNKGQYDEQGGRGRGRGWGRGNIGKEQNVSESNEGEGRGRGRGWGRGNIGKEQNVTESNEGEDSNGAIGERGRGGRGRGGRRGGGRSNNYRKDQAMKKHLSGLGGF